MSNAQLATHDKHEIAAQVIQEYIAGRSVQDIAAQHGVDRGIIYDWMLADLGPEQYQQLITRALVARVRRADEQLETAEQPHHIARARETAKFARMDLERRRPQLYGQRQQIEINMGDLGQRIAEAMQRTALVAESTPQDVVVEGKCLSLPSNKQT
jgi:transposase-like protein